MFLRVRGVMVWLSGSGLTVRVNVVDDRLFIGMWESRLCRRLSMWMVCSVVSGLCRGVIRLTLRFGADRRLRRVMTVVVMV